MLTGRWVRNPEQMSCGQSRPDRSGKQDWGQPLGALSSGRSTAVSPGTAVKPTSVQLPPELQNLLS